MIPGIYAQQAMVPEVPKQEQGRKRKATKDEEMESEAGTMEVDELYGVNKNS